MTQRTLASSILLRTPLAGPQMHLFSRKDPIFSNSSNFSRCNMVTWWWWLTQISLDNLRSEKVLRRHTCHSYRLSGWSVSKSATLTPSPKSDSQWYRAIRVWHLESCNKERPVTSKFSLLLIISWSMTKHKIRHHEASDLFSKKMKWRSKVAIRVKAMLRLLW